MKVVVGSGNNTTFSQTTDRSTPSRINVATANTFNASIALGATTDSLARTTAAEAYAQANLAYAAANVANNGANTVHVYANGESILSNSTLNFNNSASINVEASANGTLQANVSFTVNTDSLGLDNYLEKAGGTVTGSLNVNQQIYANTIDFGPYELASNSFQTTTNDVIEVDSFSAALYSTVKYIIQVKTTVNLHSTELFCIQDGISTYLSEYATLVSGAPLGNFSIQLSEGRMKLNFTPDNPTNQILKIKMVRYTIAS